MKTDQKKCLGCKAGLPLGSGRFHYTHQHIVACTHNPITNEPYNPHTKDCICTDCIVASEPHMWKPAVKLLFGKLECECGADKCNTTHSPWCPKYRGLG